MVTDTTSVPASTLNTVGAGSGVTRRTGENHRRDAADVRWQAGGAVHGRRVLPVLRGRALGHGGRAEPVRHLLRPQHRAFVELRISIANTPTWTFVKSHYTSKYLTFSTVETQSNIPTSGGSYTTLQTPTSAQQALLTKYDAPPYVSSANAGAIPFIDFGNKYMLSGASYSPQVLQGKSWSQIASALKDPTSPIAKAVDGTANYLTATICKLTGNQPASACTPVVKQLEAKF